MATIIVPRRIPLPLLESRRARNGLLPHHGTALWCAQYSNFVTSYCRKTVFQKTTAMTSPSGLSVNTVPWRWLCRTGEASTTTGALKLRAVAQAVAPCSWWLVADDGVSPVTSDTVSYIGDRDDTADDISTMGVDIEVDPDTEYECYITVVAFSKPPLSFSVYEIQTTGGAVDTADSITVDQRAFYHKAPIYDSVMQDLVQTPHDLWKHNGAQLLGVCQDVASGGWTRTTNSYANMLNTGASTTVSSSTPGFNLHTEYLNPYHTTDISAVFGVYASNANSAGGDVRLEDSSGTIGTLSSFGTAGEWKTTTVTLTGGSDQKADLQFRGDGTNELNVEAAALYVYET